MAAIRLTKELSDLQQQLAEDAQHEGNNWSGTRQAFTAAPIGDDLFSWQGHFLGPAGTPYEGGIFNFTMQFPPDYPFKPPKIRMTTPIRQMRINSEGHISHEVYTSWSPAFTLFKLLQLLYLDLLVDYARCWGDPQVYDLARQWQHDPAAFWAATAQCTREHAMGDPAAPPTTLSTYWASTGLPLRSSVHERQYPSDVSGD